MGNLNLQGLNLSVITINFRSDGRVGEGICYAKTSRSHQWRFLSMLMKCTDFLYLLQQSFRRVVLIFMNNMSNGAYAAREMLLEIKFHQTLLKALKIKNKKIFASRC